MRTACAKFGERISESEGGFGKLCGQGVSCCLEALARVVELLCPAVIHHGGM